MVDPTALETSLPYRGALARFIRRHIRGTADVDDVLQQVHFEAWQAVRAGEVIEDLRAFLFTVAKRRAIDTYRKEQTQGRVRQQVLRGLEEAHESPHDKAVLRETLERAQAELTERQWGAWQAVRVHGRSMAEAARMLGVGRKSVYRLVRRAEAVLYRGDTNGNA